MTIEVDDVKILLVTYLHDFCTPFTVWTVKFSVEAFDFSVSDVDVRFSQLHGL